MDRKASDQRRARAAKKDVRPTIKRPENDHFYISGEEALDRLRRLAAEDQSRQSAVSRSLTLGAAVPPGLSSVRSDSATGELWSAAPQTSSPLSKQSGSGPSTPFLLQRLSDLNGSHYAQAASALRASPPKGERSPSSRTRADAPHANASRPSRGEQEFVVPLPRSAALSGRDPGDVGREDGGSKRFRREPPLPIDDTIARMPTRQSADATNSQGVFGQYSPQSLTSPSASGQTSVTRSAGGAAKPELTRPPKAAEPSAAEIAKAMRAEATRAKPAKPLTARSRLASKGQSRARVSGPPHPSSRGGPPAAGRIFTGEESPLRRHSSTTFDDLSTPMRSKANDIDGFLMRAMQSTEQGHAPDAVAGSASNSHHESFFSISSVFPRSLTPSVPHMYGAAPTAAPDHTLSWIRAPPVPMSVAHQAGPPPSIDSNWQSQQNEEEPSWSAAPTTFIPPPPLATAPRMFEPAASTEEPRQGRLVVMDTSSLLLSEPGVMNLLIEKWTLCLPFTAIDELDQFNKRVVPRQRFGKGSRDGAKTSAGTLEWRRNRARELRDWINSALKRKDPHVRVQRRTEVSGDYNLAVSSNDDSILGFAVYLRRRGELHVMFVSEDKFLRLKANSEIGESFSYAQIKGMMGVRH